MNKPGFDWKKHEETAIQLKKPVNSYLSFLWILHMHIQIIVKAVKRTEKALRAINSLRSELEETIIKEHPGREDALRVYYCGVD
jgi:hypothetical protein